MSLAAITRIEAWLQRNRPRFLASLCPGVTEPVLDDWQERLGMPLPSSLRAWFGWRDGSAPEPWQSLFRDQRALGHKESEKTRRKLVELLRQGDFPLFGWWRPFWIPIFERCNGDLIVVDLVGMFGESGAVIEFWHDDPTRWVLAPSFDAWLECFACSLEAELWCKGAELHPESREPDSLWDEKKSFRDFIRSELGSHPYAIDVSREIEAGTKPLPETVKEAVSALHEPLIDAARRDLWDRLPEGWGALLLATGRSPAAAQAVVASAPRSRRSSELLLLAQALRQERPKLADGLACEAVAALDDPNQLLPLIERLPLGEGRIKEELIGKTVELARKRLSGSAALLSRVALRIRELESEAAPWPTAEHLMQWALAFTPRREGTLIDGARFYEAKGDHDRARRLLSEASPVGAPDEAGAESPGAESPFEVGPEDDCAYLKRMYDEGLLGSEGLVQATMQLRQQGRDADACELVEHVISQESDRIEHQLLMWRDRMDSRSLSEYWTPPRNLDRSRLERYRAQCELAVSCPFREVIALLRGAFYFASADAAFGWSLLETVLAAIARGAIRDGLVAEELAVALAAHGRWPEARRLLIQDEAILRSPRKFRALLHLVQLLWLHHTTGQAGDGISLLRHWERGAGQGTARWEEVAALAVLLACLAPGSVEELQDSLQAAQSDLLAALPREA